MPELDVRISRKDDDTPLWPMTAEEIDGLTFIHGPDLVWRVGIIEDGMQSGAPSIGLFFDYELDGQHYRLAAETSLALWSSVTIAARGAFPEAFKGGPLDPEGEHEAVMALSLNLAEALIVIEDARRSGDLSPSGMQALDAIQEALMRERPRPGA